MLTTEAQQFRAQVCSKQVTFTIIAKKQHTWPPPVHSNRKKHGISSELLHKNTANGETFRKWLQIQLLQQQQLDDISEEKILKPVQERKLSLESVAVIKHNKQQSKDNLKTRSDTMNIPTQYKYTT